MTVKLSDAAWFKSSHSSSDQDCVEVAFLPDGLVGVRDSKDPVGGALAFSRNEWAAFTRAVRGGEFQ
ncbi:protein of unknown function [Nocardia amikacinitolerans]|uniref:DUF397 domain-containing protein n=1 Tax=Nocardia amikacinitolerans TaxID=756689 RepID=A0A285M039_9NOCA|nr:DUF397 domain-containing protein [Nocardia amikacinitolerans]SNY89246.1 protein of unknown function [Nocardia amikacinitolerans]